MNDSLIPWFGVASRAEQEFVEYVAQRNDVSSFEAVLRSHELCVQKLSDVPEAARSILAQNFGTDYEAYVTRRKFGSSVHGRVFLVTPQEYYKLRERSLVSYGWHEFDEIEVTALDKDGSVSGVLTARAEILVDGQTVNRSLYAGPKEVHPRLNGDIEFRPMFTELVLADDLPNRAYDVRIGRELPDVAPVPGA